jgi:bifunctional non-homologous end joining protein LigD
VAAGSSVLLSDALPGSREDIESAVSSLGLEGIVAKRKRSPYAVGRRSDAWIKVRFARRQELVIGGFKPAGRNFDSIVVGYYEARRDEISRGTADGGNPRSVLMSVGKVRNGFTPASRTQLFSTLERLVVKRCPFANLPSSKSSHWGEGISGAEMLVLRWVKPLLVAEISFTEWTLDGSLRHAAFLGLRDDKNPHEVRKET